MKTNVIEINLDKPCARCGKGGATQCGLCLKCVSKRLVEKIRNERSVSMAKIGEKTISFIHDTIFHMLNEKQRLINEAYTQAEGDKLTIAISATISPAKRDSETVVKVSMSFVKEKIKDELEINIDEAQQDLFVKTA